MTDWLSNAIRHPGRVRTYLKRRYGDEAFFRDGRIKKTYIDKAIQEIKSRPPSHRPKGLLNALYLAKRLKDW
ncbi:capsid protein VP2 (plasmid) [Methanocaldococcus sp. 16A]